MSHIYAAEGMFRSLTALVGIATVDPSQLPSCVSRESIASFLEMAHPESDFRPGTPEDKLRQHILEGNEAAALVLLEDSCIRLSAEDKAGRTLLHHSAGANLLELTNALIDFGANPLAQTVAGETPLLYTMLLNGEEPEYDKSGMVLLRRDHGLTPQMASLLLRRCPQLGQIADNRNLLPSAHAAAMGDVDLLDTLKSAGVDLALAGLTGMTAHYAAACELKEDAVTYLLRNGVLPAQPAAIAGSVMRPYEVASNVARQSGQATIIPNLLFVGDINMQALQMEGRSAEQVDLLEAIAAPDTYRKILVEANANGNQSRTRVAADILSQALKLPELEPGSSESIVRRQLFDAHGIPAGMEFDVNRQDMYGQSAVMWNIAGGGPSTLSALIQRGYKLGKRDLLDNTELHRVTMVGHGKYIADLLAAGADPLARNYEGLRPLDVLQISFGVPDFVCSDESLRRGVGLILNDSRPYAHMYAHLFSATLRAEQALLAGQKKAPAQSATPSP